MKSFSGIAACLGISALLTSSALAGFLDPSSFSNINQLLSPPVVNAVVLTIGLGTDHRPYEPATPLGRKGLDLSIEATVAKIPPEFGIQLTSIGASGAADLPALPVPRLNFHKGLSDKADFGLSFILYRGFQIIGMDLKAAIAQPEEGPTWALRLCYTSASFEIKDSTTINVATKTFTPQLLVSRKLDFADPYLGVGYQYAIGDVGLTFSGFTQTASGHGGSFLAFIGTGMAMPQLGLKLTLEGSYSPVGAHTLGTKLGFSF